MLEKWDRLEAWEKNKKERESELDKWRKFGKSAASAIATSVMASVVLVGALLVPAGCGSEKADNSSRSDLIVASTTSTKDSGLFDALLPAFEQAYPAYKVKINAVGTGEALKLGERCDADVVLVHAPDAEKKFVEDGFGTERREVMYNDFIIVGPVADPAGIAGSHDAMAALKKLAVSRSKFVSRGDDSGTNKLEIKLWDKAGLGKPADDWYRKTGQGMGATLKVANETDAYTLTDRGTWLSMKDVLANLKIVVEGDRELFNQYGVIPVNPEKCPQVNAQGARDFAAWLVSPEGQKIIGDYGKDRFGQALFVPNAK
jgi:tungstate transport system substrate-binding protein